MGALPTWAGANAAADAARVVRIASFMLIVCVVTGYHKRGQRGSLGVKLFFGGRFDFKLQAKLNFMGRGQSLVCILMGLLQMRLV